MSRITKIFNKLESEGRKALIPYIMSGDPSLSATKKYIFDLERAGADIIELGVPFSDPLADGPTIQRASERSLKKGTTLRRVLAMVQEVRKKTDIPLILMTYYNPVFKFGIERFIKTAVSSGVDGVIIPDLIPDEADEFRALSRTSGLDTVFLLAPTSTAERIRKVAGASTGFIYYVSITGITGAKLTISKEMEQTLNMLKSATKKPVAVGFGISNPAQAHMVSKLADGIIIGSAIVKLIEKRKSIANFIKRVRRAI